MHLWHQYWAWAGGNIGAMPLQGLIAFLAGILFRRPLSRFITWFRREEREHSRKAAADAEAARRIAADLYLRMTGEPHPTGGDD